MNGATCVGSIPGLEPADEDEALDDLIASELVAELERLVGEAVDRISGGDLLPASGSLQALATRSQDLAGWVHRLVARRAVRAQQTDCTAAPASGMYL